LNQSTKQRIVGTVVLLALALIFLPIIFDGQGSYQGTVISRIPDVPNIPVLEMPIQIRPVVIANTDAINATNPATGDSGLAITVEAVIQESTQADQNDDFEVTISTSEPVFIREAPNLSATGLPEGWSVRLGSFSNSENATTLVQKLQDAGYKAYTRNIQSTEDVLIGVFVGPWIDRSRLDEYQQQLQEQFELAGIVVRYEVEQL
jgi:DedD protein